MTEVTQTQDVTVPAETTGETVQIAWTETRKFSAVVVPLSVVSALLTEHAPGLFSEALHTLFEDNADDDALRPVFEAMATYAEPGDVEVTEICDASVEY